MAAQPAPTVSSSSSSSRTGRTSSRGGRREGGLKLIIELEKTAAVDSLLPRALSHSLDRCLVRGSVTAPQHKAPRREEEEEEEEANQRSAEGRPYSMQVNRQTPPAPTPKPTLQGTNDEGEWRRRRMM